MLENTKKRHAEELKKAQDDAKLLAEVIMNEEVRKAQETTETELPEVLKDIKIKVVRDRAIDGRMGCGNGYRVTLENKQGFKFSTQYNDSIYNSRKNNKVLINDIIACLLSDRSCYLSSRDYEDFCAEFGYEPYEEKNYYPYYDTNTKAMRAYRACQRTSQNLEKLLSSEKLEKLHEIYQDY